MHFRWPPQSSDINIIEHIWDALQRVFRRDIQHHVLLDLWIAMQNLLCELPLGWTLVESMPLLVGALLRAHIRQVHQFFWHLSVNIR